MRRVALKPRSDPAKKAARAQRMLRGTGGETELQEQQDAQLDAQYDEKLDQRLDQRLDARMDAQLDERLDARLDQRIDAPIPAGGAQQLDAQHEPMSAEGRAGQSWPRYLPEPPASGKEAAPRPEPQPQTPVTEDKEAKARTEQTQKVGEQKTEDSVKDQAKDKTQDPAAAKRTTDSADGEEKRKTDKDKDGKKDKDEKTDAAAKGGTGAGLAQLEMVAGEDEELLVDPLAPTDETGIDISPELDFETLAADWEAPGALPRGVVPEKPQPRPPAQPEQQKQQDANQTKKGEGAKAEEPKPVAPKAGDDKAEEKAATEALEKARSAYADLASGARGKQNDFLGDANRVLSGMAQGYGSMARDTIQAHDNAILTVDAAAESQCLDIDTAIQGAQLSLSAAHDAGLGGLRAAAKMALGGINANDAKANALIVVNAAIMTMNHVGRFAGVVVKAQNNLKAAVDKVQEWSDNRADNYSKESGPLLNRAYHERSQPKVPKMAKDAIEPITKHNEEVIEKWSSNSARTLCNVACGYKNGLHTARISTFDAARKAVGEALKSAKTNLTKQHEGSQLNLRKLRHAALSQVRAQQRALRLRLTAQARAAVGGARRGAQGALKSVRGSARSALPGYWRALNGFEQNLRSASPAGPNSIKRAAATASAPLLRGLDSTGATLRHRLDENTTRLEKDQAEQQTTLAANRDTQRFEADGAMAEARTDAEKQASEGLSQFNASAGDLSRSISKAAESYMADPSTLLEKSLSAQGEQAKASLDSLFSGESVNKETPPDTPPKPAGPPLSQPVPACGPCPAEEGGDKQQTPPGTKTEGGEAPKGIDGQLTAEEEGLKPYLDPMKLFAEPVERLHAPVGTAMNKRVRGVYAGFTGAFLRSVDEGAVTGALRGTTALQGAAIDAKQNAAPVKTRFATMRGDLAFHLGPGSDDYKAADLYLQGNTKDGAKAELKASMGFFNDEEARIEAIMRALPPEDAKSMAASDPGLMAEVKDALDGTDAQVFSALADGDVATANALRMRDKIDAAKRKGDAEEVHAAEREYTTMSVPEFMEDPFADLSPEERAQKEDEFRKNVAISLGKIVTEENIGKTVEVAAKTGKEKEDAYIKNAVDYVTRDVTVHGTQEVKLTPEQTERMKNNPHLRTHKMEGANRDLAAAILTSGKDSVAAKSAELGVELQRKGEAKAENVDSTLFDEGFAPPLPPDASKEQKEEHQKSLEAARAKRAEILLTAAQKYAGAAPPPPDYKTDTKKSLAKEADPHIAAAQSKLAEKFTEKFGKDKIGAQFVSNLIKEERPSAKTASLAMQYGMYSRDGTNEDLVKRYPERMTRQEVADMRKQFKEDTGKELDAELGLYDHSGGELSGDERLEQQVAMLGRPSNDKEAAEVAAYRMRLQRDETGMVGKGLASGSAADQQLAQNDTQLLTAMGVSAEDFTPEGYLKPGKGNFDAKGRYTGSDVTGLLVATGSAQDLAKAYSAEIDSWANMITTGIAIIGAIVATVLTGGAAGPLMLAALATGLASMAANYVIKGGRYGWEQAAVDLGMTAVSVVTAGVGAKLGAAAQMASKGAQATAQASRAMIVLSKIFTGNPIKDQIIIGAVTGSIGGLGNALFNEKTWEKGGFEFIGALFDGLAKGALSGASTAAVTSSIENISRNGRTVAERLQGMTVTGQGVLKGGANLVMRSTARAGMSALGGMAGKGTEILYDAHGGKYNGRAEDAFGEIGMAGVESGVTGFGEGAGETIGQHHENKRIVVDAKQINAARAAMGKAPLDGDPLHPGSPIREAAEDLQFMRVNGKNAGKTGEAFNLDHIAKAGGMAPVPEAPLPQPRAPEDAQEKAAASKRAAEAEAAQTPTAQEPEAAPHVPVAEAETPAPRPRTTPEPLGEATPRPVGEAVAPKPQTPTETTAKATVPHEEAQTARKTPPSKDVEDAGRTPEPGDAGGKQPPKPPVEEAAAGVPKGRKGDGEAEDDRLFPGLTKEEVDAAFAEAESGPLVRARPEALGADTRPPTPANESTLLQRQRAGALHEQADGIMAKANEHVDAAIAKEAQAKLTESHNPGRAQRLREEADALLAKAVALEKQASALRHEANEFASGARSATEDLPGAEDVDRMFEGLHIEKPGLVQIPLSDLERNPALLPRLIRSMLEGEGGGRLVFRVESERSRSLVHVDADGNVRVEGGASAHLNFGSFERAMEFVLNNSQGNARIIRFEVDEDWVRAVRSAALPEHGTKDLHGQPRLVDVRFADDQFEIPPGLIGELNRMIVPRSGVVHEIPARATGGGDAGGGPPPARVPVEDGESTAPKSSRTAPEAAAPHEEAPRLRVATDDAEAPPAPRMRVATDEPAPQRRMRVATPEDEAAARAHAEEAEAMREQMSFEDAVRAETGGQPRRRAEEPVERGPYTDDAGFSTTAAAIPGSAFHGGKEGLNKRGNAAAVEREANEALVRMVDNQGGQFNGQVTRTKKDPNVLLVRKHDNSGDLEVRVVVGAPEPKPGLKRSAETTEAGRPVAFYTEDASTNRRTIFISPDASPAQIQRALAHELAELRFQAHQRPDALKPGSRPTPPPDPNAQMSRHDRGRMAEIEHLARKIEAAKQKGDAMELARLQDESGRLVAHLGLIHGEGADARLALARSAMDPGSAGARLVGDFVEAAKQNPMLEPLGAGFDDLSVLAKQAEYQRSLGKPAGDALDRAARMVVQEGLVRAGVRDKALIDDIRMQLPDDAARALFDQALAHAQGNWREIQDQIRKQAHAHTPDIMAAEIGRQRFGDHPNYQDFEEFRALYMKLNPSVDPHSPTTQRRLFERWVHGAFVTNNGGIKGISIGMIRAETVDIDTKGLSLRGDPAQEALAKAQQDAMRRRDEIDAELEGNRPPSGKSRDDLEAEYSDVMRIIRDTGEALGTGAAEKFAQDHLNNPTPIPISKTGAGVPDLAFDGPNRRLILIEAKGSEADLGFRRTADGRLAEQGTPEYLESLARDMMKPTNPPDVQTLGNRLLKAVRANPPEVDYYVVRQPIDNTGHPTELEAQKCDLTKGRTAAPAAGAPGTSP
jgi:hypothetical protein